MSDDNKSCQSDTMSLEDKLLGFCHSDSISEEGIHYFIELQKESTPDNYLHVSDYEFFHLACCNEKVTEDIIQCLLEYFPAAAATADEDGCLPIHYACRNKNVSLGIIRLLIDAAPDSVRHEDNGGDLPLHHFCGYTELKDTAALEILKLLLEKDPDSVRHENNDGQLPLHYACRSKHDTLGIIEFLIDADPDSVRHEDNSRNLPFHGICSNAEMDETAAFKILKLLLKKYPESIRHPGKDGFLPLHMAAMLTKSTERCRVLIEEYPGSERIIDDSGMLPFHYACMRSTLDVVEFLYERHRDAINHESTFGMYPIHIAIGLSPDKIEALKIVKFLLDCDSRVKFQKFREEDSLLHYACCSMDDESNIMAVIDMIEVICGAHPEFIRMEDNDGQLLLHQLCATSNQDETLRTAILRLLLEKNPDSIQHADNNGNLPIHMAAAKTKSVKFCAMLIEAYPGSEQIPAMSTGMLPFHYACVHNTVAIVEYLYNLYPDSIEHTASPGVYPVHAAFRSVIDRKDDKGEAVDIVKFLLDCNPRVKSQKLGGMISLFGSVYFQNYDDASIGAAMDIIKVIYDADPEAIESQSIASTSNGRYPETCHPQMQAFVSSQLVYSRLANDTRLMTARDVNGQLPLHVMLQSNVRLGSIKLLVKGNPNAVQTPNNSGLLPLHVACMHHKSASVVQYLIELDTTTLDAVDHDGNTALHYACRGAKYETIALLLDKYDAVSVSKRNAEGKLPIVVLWDSDGVAEESVEHLENVFRLLRVYPETVMTCE